MENVTSKFGEMLKKPGVLITGAVIGVILLIISLKNSNPDSGASATLQSQAITSQANIALSDQTMRYNTAALGYMGALANDAVLNHANDINASTAVTLHALSNLDNVNTLAVQAEMQRAGVNANIKINDANNAAMLDSARIMADTRIKLAPTDNALAERLAVINSQTTLEGARIQANAETTIARIRGGTAQNLASTQAGAQSDHDLLGIAASVAPYVAMAFMSDRRLKKNVQLVATHRLGIGIYEYDIADRHETGVMADEVLSVLPDAVLFDSDGYMMVNYEMLSHG